jgi:type IV pilus assembly protein PilQ
VEAEQAAKELEPLVTKYVSISYADASAIKTHLDEIKTDRGKVTIDERTNTIIIKDIPAAIDDATKVVKKLDVVTPQVMIEARIVEADASFTRDIGVQWGGDTTSTSSDASKTYRLFGGQTYTAGSQNYAVNLPPGSITSGLGFTFGRVAGTIFNLDARLLAMETQGKGRTISAPKIMTLDNKQATIKQGTSIPYQKSEEGTVSIEFAQANLELTVTPHITPDNRISMEISAKKDSPDWANAVGGTPAIDTKQADTELLINDGQTIVIGGILESTDEWSESRVPYLSRIPLLGWLFTQKFKLKSKDELLIFITPKILRLEPALQVSS